MPTHDALPVASEAFAPEPDDRTRGLDDRSPGPGERIRLRPHLTLLRRDDCELQLGVDDSDAVVVADPDRTLHRLLELLDGRYRWTDLYPAAARLGLAADRVDAVIATLAEAGVLQRSAGPDLSEHGVRLIGLGPVGTRIGGHLLRSGLGRLLVIDPDGAPPPSGWSHGAGRVRSAAHWSESSADRFDLTVVVGSCLEVDRAITTGLTQAGQSHLLVRPRVAGAVVGPLVLPGRTSCLGCGDLARTRADPAWPRMLAQLCRTRTSWDPLAADWAAASATTQALGHLAGRTVETASATVELGPAAWSWQRRVWSADPACGCCWSPRAEW